MAEIQKSLTPSEKRLEELEKVYAAAQAAYDKAQRYCSQLSRVAEDAYADLMSAQDANDKSETYIDVLSDGSLFTVNSDGNLELRGDGWERRRKKGDTENTDLVRVCKFGDDAMARQIAERVGELCGDSFNEATL